MTRIIPTAQTYPGTIAATLAGTAIELHPDRALWLPQFGALLITDLHLGKASHFRKHGLYVPGDVLGSELARLDALLAHYNPKQLVVLGDLFHSKHNDEWEGFGQWLLAQPGLELHLVRGNHDILPDAHYADYGLIVHNETMPLGPFQLCHHPCEPDQLPEDRYVLSGHIHPGVVLGNSSNRLRLPCFWFGQRAGLLPAWGSFTGLAMVKPQPGDQVFVLTGQSVMQVPNS